MADSQLGDSTPRMFGDAGEASAPLGLTTDTGPERLTSSCLGTYSSASSVSRIACSRLVYTTLASQIESVSSSVLLLLDLIRAAPNSSDQTDWKSAPQVFRLACTSVNTLANVMAKPLITQKAT